MIHSYMKGWPYGRIDEIVYQEDQDQHIYLHVYLHGSGRYVYHQTRNLA